MKATHAKRVFTNQSLSALLHEVAEFCEGHATDGPIVVDFDRHIMAHKATVFFLPFASEPETGTMLVLGVASEPLYEEVESVP